jgi:hypothetical protein
VPTHHRTDRRVPDRRSSDHAAPGAPQPGPDRRGLPDSGAPAPARHRLAESPADEPSTTALPAGRRRAEERPAGAHRTGELSVSRRRLPERSPGAHRTAEFPAGRRRAEDRQHPRAGHRLEEVPVQRLGAEAGPSAAPQDETRPGLPTTARPRPAGRRRLRDTGSLHVTELLARDPSAIDTVELPAPQPGRARHGAASGGRPLGHWVAGPLAAATVLTTTVVIPQVRSGGGANEAAVESGSAPDAAALSSAAADAKRAQAATTGRHHLSEVLPAPRPPADEGDRSASDAPDPDDERDDPPDATRRDDRPNKGPVGGLLGPRKTLLPDLPLLGGRHRARSSSDCSRPGGLLDLQNWKLTLPIGGGAPTEILSGQLGSFVNKDFFNTGGGCDAVTFRAPVNGVTTKGSKNPRSELRELNRGGKGNAGWSSTSGTHTMTITEAFTRLPSGKPHLVGGQIHDADDDVAVFRLEGGNLYVTNGDDPHYALVTSNYKLGTKFEAKFVVSGGQTRAYYNGRLVATISRAYSGAYFKAGAYTQANCGNASPCSSSNYGEVKVYDLKVSHT